MKLIYPLYKYKYILEPTMKLTYCFPLLLFFFWMRLRQCAWLPFESFNGYIPSYIYPIDVNAGDTIVGTLSWNSLEDLDIYLYLNGTDLLSYTNYELRQYSATNNPQIMSFKVLTSIRFWFRIDLYSTQPTPYKFQITQNGNVIGTYYDTAVSMQSQMTAQQFNILNACSVRITYDGPINNISLFKPGANITLDIPYAVNNSLVNPKVMIVTLPAPGLWTMVIKNELTTVVNINLFKITVETNSISQCSNFCTNITYAVGLVPGFTNMCYCQTGYVWNPNNLVCQIDCSSYNTSGNVGPLAIGTLNTCTCKSTLYTWIALTMQCKANCNMVTYSTRNNTLDGNCQCITSYGWNNTMLNCVKNCSLIINATSLSATNISECQCITKYFWNSTTGLCQLIPVCGDGILSGTEQCDDGNLIDGDGCNADCTKGNNNSCSAATPYIDPTTLLCTSTCPNGSYPDPSIYSCLACYYTCSTCDSSIECLSCSSTTNRYLNGTSCLPMSGFYDARTTIAAACVSPCATCTSSTLCLSCVSGFIYDGIQTCSTCNNFIQFCFYCTSSSTCLACVTNHTLSSSSQCISPPCPDPNCNLCQVSPTVCEGCVFGYQLVAGVCVGICGDGILLPSQQCDDNNTIDGDGCNKDCTIGNNNGCPAESPYGNNLTGCLSSCPIQQYNITANYTCAGCQYTCTTCTNSTGCTSCDPVTNRQLNGTLCLPTFGFYDDGTYTATPCPVPCVTCTSSTVCLTCLPGNFLSSSSVCFGCSTITPFCDVCGSGTCSHCQLGYLLNTTTLLCDVVPCIDIQCLACPDVTSQCTVCNTGYTPINGICETICGDSVKTNNEECDDGNTQAKDGCSDICTVEPEFVCELPAGTLKSQCFFNGTVNVSVLYIDKLDNVNTIAVKLKLEPSDLAAWNQINFMDMLNVSSTVSITGYQIEKNPDGSIVLKIDYATNMQGQPVDIGINPANTNNPIFQRTPATSISFVANPSDNEAAYFYEQSEYKLAQYVRLASILISALAGIFLIIGYFSAKLIGVQMMAIIQITFFTLLTISQMNPCFSALTSLKIVNGYNSLGKNSLEDSLTPMQPKGIYLFSRFTDNFNFTTAVVLIPLLVALVAFILSKTVLKDNERSINVAKRAVGEYTLMGLMLSGYIVAVSFGMEILFGIKKMDDFIGLVSLAETGIFLLMIIGYFIFLLKKPEFFGEFTECFKNDNVSSKHYNILMVERILVGSCLAFIFSSGYGAAVPLVLYLIIGIVVQARKPYRDSYNNRRAVTNMTIGISICAILMAHTMVPEDIRTSNKIFIYLPLLVCLFLIFCVLFNGIIMIYDIYRKCKTTEDVNNLDKEGLEELAKLRKISIGPEETSINETRLSPKGLEINNLRQKLKIQDLKKEMKLSLVRKQESHVPIEYKQAEDYDAI